MDHPAQHGDGPNLKLKLKSKLQNVPNSTHFNLDTFFCAQIKSDRIN